MITVQNGTGAIWQNLGGFPAILLLIGGTKRAPDMQQDMQQTLYLSNYFETK